MTRHFDMAAALSGHEMMTALHKFYALDDYQAFLTQEAGRAETVFFSFGITEANMEKLAQVMALGDHVGGHGAGRYRQGLRRRRGFCHARRSAVNVYLRRRKLAQRTLQTHHFRCRQPTAERGFRQFVKRVVAG